MVTGLYGPDHEIQYGGDLEMITMTALAIKFLMTFVFAWLTFGLMDGNFLSWVLFVAIIGTVLNYLAGDLVVLPKFGNIVASAGDGVMGALVAYIISLSTPNFVVSLTSLVIFAILIAVGEFFFHQFLLKSKKVAP